MDYNRKFSLLKSSAKNRGLKLKLKKQNYIDLVNLGCNYCGDTLKNEKGYSLDRVDSNLGYIFHNVVPCCKICNRAKSNMDMNLFLNWINRVHNHTQKQLEYVKQFTESQNFKNIKEYEETIRNNEYIK